MYEIKLKNNLRQAFSDVAKVNDGIITPNIFIFTIYSECLLYNFVYSKTEKKSEVITVMLMSKKLTTYKMNLLMLEKLC